MKSGAIALLSLLSCRCRAPIQSKTTTMKNCPMYDQH
jgi:hypothetical protein